jgi:HPt (histidine-containing phosphotransfer) domain-containing protein
MARINGNILLLRTILSDFRDQNVTTGAEIRQAFMARNSEQLLSTMHALKGVAGNIGAEALAATARAIENAVKEGNNTLCPELFDVLELQMAEVFEAAAIMEKGALQLAETAHDNQSHIGDKKALEQDIRELYALLRLNKIAAAEKFHELEPMLPASDECTVLAKQIAGFDFKGAQLSLYKLTEKMGVFIE